MIMKLTGSDSILQEILTEDICIFLTSLFFHFMILGCKEGSSVSVNQNLTCGPFLTKGMKEHYVGS